jgi:hypothetical protein
MAPQRHEPAAGAGPVPSTDSGESVTRTEVAEASPGPGFEPATNSNLSLKDLTVIDVTEEVRRRLAELGYLWE